MNFTTLNRDEYLESVQKIGDFNTLKFSKQALDWWDNHFDWKKFPPIVLEENSTNKSYLFYTVSKQKRYLTIHYLFTPKSFRNKGYANNLFNELFSSQVDEDIERFRMFCVPSSLGFYNNYGLNYWGVNTSHQYYCDFKMPKHDTNEIKNIVHDSTIEEFTPKEMELILGHLEADGKDFTLEQRENFYAIRGMLGKRYLDFVQQ
ncbi:hypothetical protein [Sulfurimonas microaerophilic]|uniref:hypothetical protein n=1 Tax=Sulfurimonas microaerophilic TaxID=3058392 RepID=UPI002714EEF4|nr:hypothetical protein [Sulfurimonas sp. hsl 1-7]